VLASSAVDCEFESRSTVKFVVAASPILTTQN
jgi:hypothetical protein